ncbi:hypothetical protein LXL04_028828 [Taraxacum kok-saghyz]
MHDLSVQRHVFSPKPSRHCLCTRSYDTTPSSPSTHTSIIVAKENGAIFQVPSPYLSSCYRFIFKGCGEIGNKIPSIHLQIV